MFSSKNHYYFITTTWKYRYNNLFGQTTYIYWDAIFNNFLLIIISFIIRIWLVLENIQYRFNILDKFLKNSKAYKRIKNWEEEKFNIKIENNLDLRVWNIDGYRYKIIKNLIIYFTCYIHLLFIHITFTCLRIMLTEKTENWGENRNEVTDIFNN